MMRVGGCLCGAVRYAVRGPLREILVCHCHECRRWTGRAWAVTAARDEDLEIDAGGALVWIESPRSALRANRGFCSACGSSLFFKAPGRHRTGISAGSLDDLSGLRIAAHIWVEQAVEWDPPAADLPRYGRSYPDDAPPLAWS
jgi:hypothetical protein